MSRSGMVNVLLKKIKKKREEQRRECLDFLNDEGVRHRLEKEDKAANNPCKKNNRYELKWDGERNTEEYNKKCEEQRQESFNVRKEQLETSKIELTKIRSNPIKGSSAQINEELTSTIKNKYQHIHPRHRSSSWSSPFSNSRSISLSTLQPLSPERSRYNHRDRNNIEDSLVISSSRKRIDKEEMDILVDSDSIKNTKVNEKDSVISKPVEATTEMIYEHPNSKVEVNDVEKNILNPTKENNNLSEDRRKNPTVISSSSNSTLDINIPTTNMLTQHKPILPSKSNNVKHTVQETNKSNRNQSLTPKTIRKDSLQYNRTQKKINFRKDTAQYDHIRRTTNDDSNLAILPLICKNIQK